MKQDLTLGQLFYRENYLTSAHWENLKQKYWASKLAKKCRICWSRTNLILHHRTYDTLENEEIGKDVILLCWDCHKSVHFGFLGVKTPLVKNKLVRRERYLRLKFILILVLFKVPYRICRWLYIEYGLKNKRKRAWSREKRYVAQDYFYDKRGRFSLKRRG